MNTIGERIRHVRKERGYTQETFGSMIGVSKTQVCEMESGTKYPTQAALGAIYARFGVEPNWIMAVPSAEELLLAEADALLASLCAACRKLEAALEKRQDEVFAAIPAFDFRALKKMDECRRLQELRTAFAALDVHPFDVAK